jgi:GAF domain-containing protein
MRSITVSADAPRAEGLAARQMANEVASAEAMARECVRMLEQSGPMTVLRVLNSRTRFRFSGIYRADPPLLRNLFMYDRENPTLNVSGEVSHLDETYCALVCGDERPFATESSAADVRLVQHAARECVRSYCGVPIRSASGRVWGTLCHYDVRPRLVQSTEIAVLERVAALLTSRLTTLAPLD